MSKVTVYFDGRLIEADIALASADKFVAAAVVGVVADGVATAWHEAS